MDKKERFLKALGENEGNVSAACEAMEVSRQAYYKWRKSDPDFAMQCDIIIQSHTDARKERKRQEKEQRAAMFVPAIPASDIPEPEAYEGERAVKLATEHVEFLVETLKAAGLYDHSLDAQIRTAAKLHASIQILFSQIDRYAPLLTELSREGNTRLTSNPIHEMLRKQTDTYTTILKTLGLNFETKAKVKEEDGIDELFKGLNEE